MPCPHSIAVVLAIAVATSSAEGACYAWPLREPIAHDGDTIYLTIPELPPELRQVSARLLNIDAPELNAKCVGEKLLALRAREQLRAMLAATTTIEVCPIGSDKYAARSTPWSGETDSMWVRIWSGEPCGLSCLFEMHRTNSHRPPKKGRGRCGDIASLREPAPIFGAELHLTVQ